MSNLVLFLYITYRLLFPLLGVYLFVVPATANSEVQSTLDSPS